MDNICWNLLQHLIHIGGKTRGSRLYISFPHTFFIQQHVNIHWNTKMTLRIRIASVDRQKSDERIGTHKRWRSSDTQYCYSWLTVPPRSRCLSCSWQILFSVPKIPWSDKMKAQWVRSVVFPLHCFLSFIRARRRLLNRVKQKSREPSIRQFIHLSYSLGGSRNRQYFIERTDKTQDVQGRWTAARGIFAPIRVDLASFYIPYDYFHLSSLYLLCLLGILAMLVGRESSHVIATRFGSFWPLHKSANEHERALLML